MRRSATHLIAREGWPFIIACVLLGVLALRLNSLWLGALSIALLVAMVLLFRDPPREIPSQPLAVLSPVDGRIMAVEHTDRGCLQREATRIRIRVHHSGAYTARSPVEGKVLNLQDNFSAGSRLLGVGGLWVRTDEQDDIVVLMHGPRILGRPVSFIGYGERLGQGQRFAFIRLAARADIFIPLNSTVVVATGDVVRAGQDILARLIHD